MATLREQYQELLKMVEAIPEGDRLFLAGTVVGETVDTDRTCRCAVGSILPVPKKGVRSEAVADRLTTERKLKAEVKRHGLEMKTLCSLESLNDGFYEDDAREKICKQRYDHVVKRLKEWIEEGL